ncbi:hypothetical protein BpHYR1_003005, partial [Brachionus plicatilis]
SKTTCLDRRLESNQVRVESGRDSSGVEFVFIRSRTSLDLMIWSSQNSVFLTGDSFEMTVHH